MKSENIIRKCEDCGKKITNCMGYVNATDFLARKSHIRELCGKCVILRDIESGLLKVS
jgi:hypothetical protein